MIPGSDEEREVLVEALDSLMRKLRDYVRTRPERRGDYDFAKARTYHLAADLRDRIRRLP